MQNDVILIVHSLQSLLTEVLCITGNSPRPSLVLFRSMLIPTAVYHPAAPVCTLLRRSYGC